MRCINVEPLALADVDADVAIIDTGVDPANTALNVVFQKGFGFADAKDSDGHGTQIASVAAAKGTDSGVTGVAPSARVWALKVVTERRRRNGVGIHSRLDDVAANCERIDVANIGVLAASPLRTVNRAADACVHAGVVVVVAAGNNRGDAGAVPCFRSNRHHGGGAGR